MTEQSNVCDLVRQAQAGSPRSMDQLAHLTRPKVYVYLFRLTLDQDLAQDLTQETMLEMVRSLKRLNCMNRPHRFWAWLYRTATGKTLHYYRDQGSNRIWKRTKINMDSVLAQQPTEENPALHRMIKQELWQIMIDAMAHIKPRYRSVLTLRCLEQMPYADVASVLGCSEVQAQLLFFRAKHSLRQHMKKKGFGKEHFVPALALFATVTAGSSKGVPTTSAISAVTTNLGLTATALGIASTKTGLSALAATCAVAFACTSLYTYNQAPHNRYCPDTAIDSATVNKNDLAFPLALLAAHDPDGSGWKCVDFSRSSSTPRPMAPERLLVGNRPQNSLILIVPKDHWLELGFAGTIVDGPGIDLYFDGRTLSTKPQVFLTNGAGQEYELVTPSGYKNFGGGYKLTLYDLNGISLPFEPNAVRIVGTNNDGPWMGTELYVVRARIEN